ncbi:MAG: xanthine dehydrogenase subunit D [Chloroflexota bacterium]|nr:MAG: xanthine dehydrogenase subunit D [Chloroflexota bacterium]
MNRDAALARIYGRIGFAEDARAPGMLHAAILRSPYPSARIARIDANAARALSGVIAVATGAEAGRRRYGPQVEDQPILADGLIRYVGEPVAAIAGETEDAARRAVEFIEVDYEPLPAVFDPVVAVDPSAPLVHPDLEGAAGGSLNFDIRPRPGTNICHVYQLRAGDVEAGFREADVVVEDTFQVPSAQHVAMEPRVTLAEWCDDRLILTTGTQTPFDTRRILASLFDLPVEAVRVIAPPLGGGYGGKSFPKMEPIAALLARISGRPVRLALRREEEFVTANRHASTIHMRIGARRDGRLVAKEIVVHWNTGAYADSGPGVAQKGGYHGIGPYRIPNVAVASYCVYTNLPPNGAFRGYSATQPVFATERLMDRLAGQLGMDPLDLRRRNLLRPGDVFSTGETMGDVHFDELLATAADGVGWRAAHEVLPDGRRRGWGLGITLKGMQTPSRCAARVAFEADGTFRLDVGTVEMGQGSRTAFAGVVADALAQDATSIRVVQSDTDRVPYDTRTTSSRSSFMIGNAARRAAEALRERLIATVAARRGVLVEEIRLTDGAIVGPFGSLSLATIASEIGPIEVEGEFRNEGRLEPDSGTGVASSQWNQSAVGARVVVDPATGKVEVEHIHASVYAGRVLNPIGARLQTAGNVVMGVGSALFEEVLFDGGQIVNGNLSDYPIPSMLDAPREVTMTLLEQPGAEPHGLGETALPPTPAAIANAIAQAMGIEIRRIPVTPERVLGLADES